MTVPVPRKILLDTNVYVDWINRGHFEGWMVGRDLVRHLSAVVCMELRAGARTLPARRAVDQLAGAYEKAGRLCVPSAGVFDQAGRTLRRLRDEGRDVRQASLVNDVLIALSARAIGATVITMDSDFRAIAAVISFEVEVVPPE